MSAKRKSLETCLAMTSGSPLVIPVSPKLGEGLPELVLRAASENSYTNTSTVLSISGLSGIPAAVGSNAVGHEEELARILGIEGGRKTIANLTYEPVKGRAGWHQFFGTPIRLAHREVERRRVSPLALRRSNHARAIWSIKVFSFDPETKEMLLDKCPECGKWLGYSLSYGVNCCGACLGVDADGFIRSRVDFRDFPQPVVEVEDIEALDFVTGLIDPNPEVRSRFRPEIPEAFLNCSRGELFEFAVALACVITADPAKVPAFLPRPRARDDYSRFTPEVLALAGRTILSWPKGFDQLASMARENADLRMGHYGIQKELGSILALKVDAHIGHGLRQECKAVIDGNMRRTAIGHTMVRRKENLFRDDLMTTELASKRCGITRKVIRQFVCNGTISSLRAGTAEKGPVLVSQREIEAVLTASKRSVPAASLSNRLGLPVMVLQSLATVGLLEEKANPAKPVPGCYYFRDSVEALLGQLESCARPISTRANLLDLRRAALLAGSPTKNPWPGIFRAVINGQVTLFSAGYRKGLLKRYFLEKEAIPIISEKALPWPESVDRAQLSHADVGCLLNIPIPSVYALMQDGLLSRAPVLGEVQNFYNVFVMSGEAACMLSGREDLNDWETSRMLSFSMLEPVYTTTYKKRRIWRRGDVLQLAGTLRTS